MIILLGEFVLTHGYTRRGLTIFLLSELPMYTTARYILRALELASVDGLLPYLVGRRTVRVLADANDGVVRDD